MRTALRRPGRLFYLLLIVASTLNAYAAPTTATVSGVIYRADGTPASGTLLISWPAFNTAGGDAVAAGSMSLAIGPSGAISLALAPTEGATPAGVSYKVIYKLNDGTTSTETWVVPAAGPVTIAAIRARVSSSTMALAWGNATQLQGKPIATTAPQNGQTLIYSAAGSRYEPQMPVAEVPDADAVTKGKVQLAGDLGGTASAPTVPALAAKANQSALDATNNAAATHYSSTAAHSAAAIPAANRIVMSGAAGKLDKGWLPSAVDPMTLGTGANGSALSIKSPDASNFLRISAIDNGPNPGQVDAACGAMHDIFYPFGYNSVYGANYDASKPTFEETLETNWCPGDGHAYFEWYKQFYAPWTGGAVAPIRPISFQVRKDGSHLGDYVGHESHIVTAVGYRHLPTDAADRIHLDVASEKLTAGIIDATKSDGSAGMLKSGNIIILTTDGSGYTTNLTAQNTGSVAGNECTNYNDTTYTNSTDGNRRYTGRYRCGDDLKWDVDYPAEQVWSAFLPANMWGQWRHKWTISHDIVVTRIDVQSLDSTNVGTCTVPPKIYVRQMGQGNVYSSTLNIPNGASAAALDMSSVVWLTPGTTTPLYIFAEPGTCTGNNTTGASSIVVTYRAR